MNLEGDRQFDAGHVPVHIFQSKRDMGRAAAEQAATWIRAGIERRGRARIIIGTGNSQDEVIDELIRQPIDFTAVEAFHMDEYAGMADTHPASFRRWLRTRFADVAHPAATHYMAGDAVDPDQECRRYGRLICEAPIDVCFIGFGENGHIAFNDPHVADFDDPLPVKRVAMDERCRMQQVGEGHFPSLAAAPAAALTLTCPTLMRSEHLVCTVPDARKAEATRNAIEGPLTTDCPSSVVLTHPSCSIFLDVHSASLLTPR